MHFYNTCTTVYMYMQVTVKVLNNKVYWCTSIFTIMSKLMPYMYVCIMIKHSVCTMLCRVERRTKANQKSVKFTRNDSSAGDDKKERVRASCWDPNLELLCLNGKNVTLFSAPCLYMYMLLLHIAVCH